MYCVCMNKLMTSYFRFIKTFDRANEGAKFIQKKTFTLMRLNKFVKYELWFGFYCNE